MKRTDDKSFSVIIFFFFNWHNCWDGEVIRRFCAMFFCASVQWIDLISIKIQSKEKLRWSGSTNCLWFFYRQKRDFEEDLVAFVWDFNTKSHFKGIFTCIKDKDPSPDIFQTFFKWKALFSKIANPFRTYIRFSSRKNHNFFSSFPQNRRILSQTLPFLKFHLKFRKISSPEISNFIKYRNFH